jgi:dTDP-4-amino-4,6-dideoxygalactose transaminase
MSQNIPFMRLDRQFSAHKEDFMAAVETVFSHGRVLQGKEVAQLEERIAEFMDLQAGAAVGSGTDALVLALTAAGVRPGDKVAVTSLSFMASASAIVLAGGVPVFVDVDERDYQARTDLLAELASSGKVRGILAVHLYGQLADLAEVREAADKAGVFLIEDCAQVLGASRNGVFPGRGSKAVCLSFDPTKVIGAQGSGGMVLSNDEELIERVRRLRYHGHAGGRVYTEIGRNSQLPTVQAALLSIKMDHEREWRQRRQDIAKAYTEALAEHPAIQAPRVSDGNEHIFHKYVMRVPENRDGLAAFLKERGIATSVHYSKLLPEQPCLQNACEIHGFLDVAARLTHEVLSLPIYPELTAQEIDRIVVALADWRG